MAMCRCKFHPPTNSRSNTYINWVYPIGHPNSSAICGIKGCISSGYIYLTDDEYKEFLKGEEYFGYHGTVIKTKVINPNVSN